MTLLIRIIFILICHVLIFNPPESLGIQNYQGYHVSTINEELTPSERLAYALSGTLPSRIQYVNGNYMVTGQPRRYRNDLRRKKGKPYKAVPRWQYYLNQLSPANLIKSGLELASFGKDMAFGRGFMDFGDGDMDGGIDDDADDDGTNNDGTNNDGDDAEDSKKDPGLLSQGMDMGKGLMSPLFNLFGGNNDENTTNNNENKGDDNDKKDEKKAEEPGLLSKGIDMGKGLMSLPFSLFGGNGNTNNNANNDKKDDDKGKKDEKKDDDKDNKEGDKPAEPESYMDMAKGMLESDAVVAAKDILESDTAKEAVKTGISLFVPGGPAIVAAMDAAQKYQKADAAVDKVEDKLPKFK